MQLYTQRGTERTATVGPQYTTMNSTSCRATLTCNAAIPVSEYDIKSKSRICSGALLIRDWPSQLLAIQTAMASLLAFNFLIISNIAFEEYSCIFMVIKPGD